MFLALHPELSLILEYLKNMSSNLLSLALLLFLPPFSLPHSLSLFSWILLRFFHSIGSIHKTYNSFHLWLWTLLRNSRFTLFNLHTNFWRTRPLLALYKPVIFFDEQTKAQVKKIISMDSHLSHMAETGCPKWEPSTNVLVYQFSFLLGYA